MLLNSFIMATVKFKFIKLIMSYGDVKFMINLTSQQKKKEKHWWDLNRTLAHTPNLEASGVCCVAVGVDG